MARAKQEKTLAITEKQKRFAEEYIIDLNATQAAIRAGYSEKTSMEQGYQLLQKTLVQQYIQQLMDKRSKKTEITAEWVLNSIKEVAERCMQKVPVMYFDKETKMYVQEKTEDGEGVWQFDSSGANKSLENLGKHLKLFTDKVEHSGEIKMPTIVITK